ncbi:TfoX/Sxy family protein [Leeia sp.]|uniref:TfoX/Sxy family protein n=1 Tax=Leeia sp. TaxID=2884678 RepID=UPI0035B305D7
MAVDPALADEIRGLLSGEPGVDEKKMFGGLCWMWRGHMLCCISKDGRYLFRVGPAQQDEALARPGATVMVHGGRTMTGFIWVEAAPARAYGLTLWLDLARHFVESLPPK